MSRAMPWRRVNPVRVRVTGRSATGAVLVSAVLATILTAGQLLAPVHIVDPGGRAAVEATITLTAIFSGLLLLANFERARALPELLLTYALIAVSMDEIVYHAAPAFMSRVALEPSVGSVTSASIVALAFAAAASAPARAVRGSGRMHATAALAVCTAPLLLNALLGHPTGRPFGLAAKTASVGLLTVGGIAFLRRCRRGQLRCGSLAAAAFLLAGAQLQYFALGAFATDWVTPAEGLRLGACCALLGASCWRYVKARRGDAYAAVASERERIARDLHDGLAQDLVCIAGQIKRLGGRLGVEDPMMIAARHALATSRGTIVDLAASTARSTEAALRMVAAELEHRFDLVIDVRVERPALAGTDDLDPTRREHLVRIAREAIVNAALHGGAGHVQVRLLRRGGDLIMQVADDGCGITDAAKTGVGLRTLHARAAALGGRVTTRPREDGGTEMELLVS